MCTWPFLARCFHRECEWRAPEKASYWLDFSLPRPASASRSCARLKIKVHPSVRQQQHMRKTRMAWRLCCGTRSRRLPLRVASHVTCAHQPSGGLHINSRGRALGRSAPQLACPFVGWLRLPRKQRSLLRAPDGRGQKGIDDDMGGASGERKHWRALGRACCPRAPFLPYPAICAPKASAVSRHPGPR